MRAFAETLSKAQTAAGLRAGAAGTHSTRTMMLAEISEVLRAGGGARTREEVSALIVDENLLGKDTVSNRRLTNQRLGELYALDRSTPIYRVFCRIWEADPEGRPLSALLCCLARDPLLRATAGAVVSLAPGEELPRTAITKAIRDAVGERMNDASIDKVARNASSTWAQSGHLEGRVRKIRRRVDPTPGPVAFALWLGSLEGLAGEGLLSSSWVEVLDRSPAALVEITLRARQLGLVEARVGGGVVEIDARGLDPAVGGR